MDIENQYYTAKGVSPAMLHRTARLLLQREGARPVKGAQGGSSPPAGLLESSDPREAVDAFKCVIQMEKEKGEWCVPRQRVELVRWLLTECCGAQYRGFKALKQLVKLHFKLKNHRDMMESYRQLLSYVKSNAVTRNYSEKVINSILDHVSSAEAVPPSEAQDLLAEFYETTLRALEEAKNERLWFKTNLKLCKLWFDLREFGRMAKIIRDLHGSCQTASGVDDQSKGTQLLEVYAVEIQMHTEQKNTKQLKQLYHRALNVKSAIPHPRIMGIIRECGGKMHMAQRTWAEAATDFFEAFKSYDEAGSARRVQCLKYLVLANMLMNSAVNPFDAQEAKPYKNDPEIMAMTTLVAAYQRNEIGEFERILKSNRRAIMEDVFMRNYIEDLLKAVRTQVLLRLIKPYTRVRLATIAGELGVSEAEVETLLVSLILDNKVDGHIDKVDGLLEMREAETGAKKYIALAKCAEQLRSLHAAATARIGGT